MTTVKSFVNQTDAALALSRLEAEGIEGFLADDTSCAVIGAGTPGVPLRLQVADEDAERAAQILGDDPGTTALSDNSALPELSAKTGPILLAIIAFAEGGIWAMVVLGLFAVLVIVCCGKAEGHWSDVVLVFVIGGLCGLLLRVAGKEPRGGVR